jgi:hypothetical protein
MSRRNRDDEGGLMHADDTARKRSTGLLNARALAGRWSGDARENLYIGLVVIDRILARFPFETQERAAKEIERLVLRARRLEIGYLALTHALMPAYLLTASELEQLEAEQHPILKLRHRRWLTH